MDVTHRQMVWSHYVPWHAPFNTSSLVNRHYNFPTFQSVEDEMLDYKDEIRQASGKASMGSPLMCAYVKTAPSTLKGSG